MSQFSQTGNPFVDNGLAVLATLAQRNSLEDLDLSAIRAVVGDASQLTADNARAKSFTMVFGTNGPLKQYAYQKIGKNEIIYRAFVAKLVQAMETEGSSGEPCELTGIPTNLDFHALCSAALVAGGQPAPERKWIGREWVPLAGSLGNDAQALPAASRPLHVSAIALLALQYLPYALCLMRGKLVLHQCTYHPLVQRLVDELVQQNRSRMQAGNFEILNKGGGTAAVIENLRLAHDRLAKAQRKNSLPAGTALFLWLFTNSGAGADCDLIPVPQPALTFLWRSFSEFGEEIRDLIRQDDPKDPRRQLLQAIVDGRDHPVLYPDKKWKGASQAFYEHYQRSICGRTNSALRSASLLAAKTLAAAERKRADALRKPDALRQPENRNYLRARMLDSFTPADYDALFPSTRHPVRVAGQGWELLRFYLMKEGVSVTATTENEVDFTTHPKIAQIAEHLYRTRDVKRLESIVNRLDPSSSRYLGRTWLESVFCKLAREQQGFDCPGWDEFACDTDGKPIVRELLFQLRLALCNYLRVMPPKTTAATGTEENATGESES